MSLYRLLFGSEPVKKRTGSSSSKFRPQLHSLETRETPAIFTVTNTANSIETEGSLPWAVHRANYFSDGLDYVYFNIPGNGGETINLNQTLFLNDQIVIDATTQPGYNGTPLITVRGSQTVSSLFLLQADPQEGTNSSGSTIQGLAMSDYSANAVTIFSNSVGNWIQNNWIGFYKDAQNVVHRTTDTIAPPNFFPAGVGIQSNFNIVRQNTISGVFNGVVMGEAIEGTWSGTNYFTNSIRENFIGTDPTGSTAAGYGNQSDGIFLGAGARENFLGPDNVISGNASAGIEFLHPSNIGNVVFRSKIGTNAAGTGAVGNGELGILIANGANGNAIGGPFGGNIISGNSLGGISLGTPEFGASIGNFIQFNIFGLNSTQTAIVGVQNIGISLSSGSTYNVIQSNVLAGHTTHGMVVQNSQTNNLQNNWIGQSANLAQFANGGFGVALIAGGSFNFVTGNAFGTNTLGNIFVDPTAVGNAIS